MSSRRPKTFRSSLRTQRTPSDNNIGVPGLATSTTVPSRRRSDEVIVFEWHQCLSRRPTEVNNIAYQFAKIGLTDQPVDQSTFKEVLKNLSGTIAKGFIIVQAGIYHMVTTTREVLLIPHRRLLEYIRQQQFAVQSG